MVYLIIQILCFILSLTGIAFLVPVATALYCGEYSVLSSFLIPMIIVWVVSIAVVFLTRKKKSRLSIRASFVVVALAWVCISLFGALPFYISGAIPSFTDAFFESVSGFTTTGSTILSEIETLPRSINLWRCLTHWIGGMGIVVLTVALLPILGVGGFQLVKAETTGPEKGKVTAKITTTSKILWLIYLALTLIETLILKCLGMDFIDALSHSFSTLGTGGFSTRNSSIGSFNSPAIEIVCTVFMFLAGVNFSMYYYLIARKFSDIRDNSELKFYILIIVVAILLIASNLTSVFKSFTTALRYASFQVAAILSTTGFANADYLDWPAFSQMIIFILFFIGGCSGSTSGGVKVVRWLVLLKALHIEFKEMLHPHGVFAMRLNKRNARKELVNNIASFLTLYLGLILITTIIGTIGKLDILSAFTGSITMVGNVGPAYGVLGPSANFDFLPAFVKWWYCFAMIAGRLEFFTIFVFFVPSFWKK